MGPAPGQFLNGTRHYVFTGAHPRCREGLTALPPVGGNDRLRSGRQGLSRNVGDARAACCSGQRQTPSSRALLSLLGFKSLFILPAVFIHLDGDKEKIFKILKKKMVSFLPHKGKQC